MDCGFLNSAAEKSFDLVATPVLRHVCYPFRAAGNVGRLRGKLEHLNNIRNDINGIIQQAEGSGGLKESTSQAKGWLDRTEKAATEAEAVAKDYDGRSCVLVSGCSFDCWSNYRIGRRADKMIQQVEELLSQVPPPEAIIRDAPLPPVQERPTDSIVPGGPLEKYLQEATCFLGEKEEGVLGIWGMGGVGKTTLLTKINNSLLKDSPFDRVVWVVASKDCTEEKLQERILKKLGGLPEGQEAATFIFNFFNGKKFILLIDDVWNKLDLTKVGIPHPLGSKDQLKRKIILTTRSEDVCGNMGAHSMIRVDCLPRELAWSLFREMVGEKTLNSHPGILELAERVAEECGGLPLALTVVGRSMSTKTSLRTWNNTINSMQNSNHLPGTEKDLFHRLKLSYDNLEYAEDRECFLICSLWPEDHSISEIDLVDCWMGMDRIEDYESGESIIDRLKAACLLEAGLRRYGEFEYRLGYIDTVKMHDVIRDMALWIVSEREKKWTVFHAGLPDGRRRWSESHIISLSHGRFDGTVPFEVPNCPNLTTLMLTENDLFGNRNSRKWREFLNVSNFCILTYLDLSSTGLDEFPMGICGLIELGYLNLSDNEIKFLPEELEGLSKLRYLMVRNNPISTIPRGLLLKLKKLRVLDLYTSDYDASPIFDQLDLAESHLRTLGINVFTISEMDRLIKSSSLSIESLGVKGMEDLNSFELSSLDTIGRRTLTDLHIEHAEIKEIIIESSTDHHHLEALVFLRLWWLQNLEAIIWKRVAPKDFFPRLCVVDIYDCAELKHVSWILHLPCLEYLKLYGCDRLEQLVIEPEEEIQLDENRQGAVANSFPSLKSLHLSYLRKLAQICDPAMDFPSLESVEIFGCSQLKELPFRLIPTCNHMKLKKVKIEGKIWEDDSIRTSLLPGFKQWMLHDSFEDLVLRW